MREEASKGTGVGAKPQLTAYAEVVGIDNRHQKVAGESPDALACRAGGSDGADLSNVLGENERRNGLSEVRQLFFSLKPRARCPSA